MLNGEVGTDVGGYREVEQVELANSVSSIEHGDCRYTVQRQPRVRHTATDTVSTSPEECRPPPVCYGHPTHTQRRRQICLHERERQPGKQRPLVTVILVNMNVTCGATALPPLLHQSHTPFTLYYCCTNSLQQLHSVNTEFITTVNSLPLPVAVNYGHLTPSHV